MFEELKLILDSLGDLSGVALWVVGGFLAYKIIVYGATTGSLFVLTKLLIERLFDYLKGDPDQPKVVGLKKGIVERLCITHDGTHEDLIVELRRLASTAYIHSGDVAWLRKQIDKRES